MWQCGVKTLTAILCLALIADPVTAGAGYLNGRSPSGPSPYLSQALAGRALSNLEDISQQTRNPYTWLGLGRREGLSPPLQTPVVQALWKWLTSQRGLQWAAGRRTLQAVFTALVEFSIWLVPVGLAAAVAWHHPDLIHWTLIPVIAGLAQKLLFLPLHSWVPAWAQKRGITKTAVTTETRWFSLGLTGIYSLAAFAVLAADVSGAPLTMALLGGLLIAGAGIALHARHDALTLLPISQGNTPQADDKEEKGLRLRRYKALAVNTAILLGLILIPRMIQETMGWGFYTWLFAHPGQTAMSHWGRDFLTFGLLGFWSYLLGKYLSNSRIGSSLKVCGTIIVVILAYRLLFGRSYDWFVNWISLYYAGTDWRNALPVTIFGVGTSMWQDPLVHEISRLLDGKKKVGSVLKRVVDQTVLRFSLNFVQTTWIIAHEKDPAKRVVLLAVTGFVIFLARSFATFDTQWKFSLVGVAGWGIVLTAFSWFSLSSTLTAITIGATLISLGYFYVQPLERAKRHILSVVRKHQDLTTTSPKEVLRSALDPKRLTIQLAVKDLAGTDISPSERLARDLAFDNTFRDLVNGMPLRARLDLFSAKLTQKDRRESLLDFLRDPAVPAGGEPNDFRLLDVEAVILSRAHEPGHAIYRLKLEWKGREQVVYLKTVGREEVSRRNQRVRLSSIRSNDPADAASSDNTVDPAARTGAEQHESFFYDVSRRVGLPSIRSHYYEEKQDPDVVGYRLLEGAGLAPSADGAVGWRSHIAAQHHSKHRRELIARYVWDKAGYLREPGKAYAQYGASLNPWQTALRFAVASALNKDISSAIDVLNRYAVEYYSGEGYVGQFTPPSRKKSERSISGTLEFSNTLFKLPLLMGFLVVPHELVHALLLEDPALEEVLAVYRDANRLLQLDQKPTEADATYAVSFAQHPSAASYPRANLAKGILKELEILEQGDHGKKHKTQKTTRSEMSLHEFLSHVLRESAAAAGGLAPEELIRRTALFIAQNTALYPKESAALTPYIQRGSVSGELIEKILAMEKTLEDELKKAGSDEWNPPVHPPAEEPSHFPGRASEDDPAAGDEPLWSDFGTLFDAALETLHSGTGDPLLAIRFASVMQLTETPPLLWHWVANDDNTLAHEAVVALTELGKEEDLTWLLKIAQSMITDGKNAASLLETFRASNRHAAWLIWLSLLLDVPMTEPQHRAVTEMLNQQPIKAADLPLLSGAIENIGYEHPVSLGLYHLIGQSGLPEARPLLQNAVPHVQEPHAVFAQRTLARAA